MPPMTAAWRFLILMALAAAAAGAAGPPASPPSVGGTGPAEPGEGEALALIDLAAAMGATPGLLADWNVTMANEGSLCGWQSLQYTPPPNFPGIVCDNATGAITEM